MPLLQKKPTKIETKRKPCLNIKTSRAEKARIANYPIKLKSQTQTSNHWVFFPSRRR